MKNFNNYGFVHLLVLSVLGSCMWHVFINEEKTHFMNKHLENMHGKQTCIGKKIKGNH